MKSPQMHSRSSNGAPLYERACADCGMVSLVEKARLTKPCHACAMRRRRTHGLAGRGVTHQLYKTLKGMVARCDYASATHYQYYGARGIKVCDEWRDDPAAFAAWARDNGWEPGLEIDRVDADGDYCPENCRFITHRENSQNRRKSSMTVERAAEIREALESGVTVKQASVSFGVSYMVAWHLKNSPDVWRAA